MGDWIGLIFFLGMAGVLKIVSDLSALERKLASLSQLEAKVALLLKHASLEYDPAKGVSPQIVDALKRGAKVEAVRLYREQPGVGLVQAKEFVEAIERRLGQ